MYPAAAMWAYSSGSRSRLDTPWGREDAMSEYKDSEAPPGLARGQSLQAYPACSTPRTDTCISPTGHGDASVHEERRIRHDPDPMRDCDQVANHQGRSTVQAELLPQDCSLLIFRIKIFPKKFQTSSSRDMRSMLRIQAKTCMLLCYCNMFLQSTECRLLSTSILFQGRGFAVSELLSLSFPV